MIQRIINARLIQDGRVLSGPKLYFENGRITYIGEENRPWDETIDAAGRYVSPGFIDLHTHGGGGADFMDGTKEAFLTAASMHARHGTATLIPTATSGSLEEILGMENAWAQAVQENSQGADMPGLHLEGPYFSPAQSGAQDPKFLRCPDPGEYLEILRRCPHILRWSAAPELPGALEFARELKSRGILAAMGHTDADYDEAVQGWEAGFTHVTHLYSCMSTVHRKHAYRYAGVLEAAYLTDGLTVEIIADGAHLPPALLQFVYRFKGPQSIALVTDSMRAAGMPEGKTIMGSLKNGFEVIVEDGVAKLMDRSAFAGSVATMDRLVRNMVRLAGVPLPQAVEMAAATPARIMGFGDRGRLLAGLRADLTFFDDDIAVSRVIVGGKTVWEEK